MLIAHGADVNVIEGGEYGWTPLIHASRYGHTKTAEVLIANGADVDLRDDGEE